MAKNTTKDEVSAGFVVCIRNDGYEVSLELRKVYEVMAEERLDPPEAIRVIDESGEDYLFPREFFIPIDMSRDAEALVRKLP